MSRIRNRVLQPRSALRTLLPPVKALFLAAMVGMLLGNAVPMSDLQQAASPLAQFSSSILSGT